MKKSIALLTLLLTLCAVLLCGTASFAAVEDQSNPTAQDVPSSSAQDEQDQKNSDVPDTPKDPNPPKESYTVTWVVDGKATTESYLAGETPAFKGLTVKASDGQYSYLFKSWDKELKPITGNITYTAVFEKTPVYYVVTWVVDGNPETESYPAGESPVYKGNTDKEPDEKTTYLFKGWTPALQPVVGNITYTAEYEQSPRKYTVTWVVGAQRTSESYKYGETPAFDGTPEKEPERGYSYLFKGWDQEIGPVAGDITYTAVFEQALRQYTVTWIVDGTETKENYAFGETPKFKGSTEKTPTEKISYLFKGWDSELLPVTEDTVFTAEYEEATREYTVTWFVNGKRTVESYGYGEIPAFKGSTEKPADEKYQYEFQGWDREPGSVTADSTYTAVFSETPLKAPEAPAKSSILSSPLFWILIILVGLGSLAGIGILFLQKLKRDDPEKYAEIIALLPAVLRPRQEEISDQSPEPGYQARNTARRQAQDTPGRRPQQPEGRFAEEDMFTDSSLFEATRRIPPLHEQAEPRPQSARREQPRSKGNRRMSDTTNLDEVFASTSSTAASTAGQSSKLRGSETQDWDINIE